MPRHVFKSYREILGAPDTWVWHKDLVLTLSNGSLAYFCHGKVSDVLRHSQMLGMNVVTGHFHEKFEIRYWGNSMGLFWAMVCGCLIDDDSMAYAYNKLNIKRPVIGTGIIIEGIPKLLPMAIGKDGRWNGVVP
jgi:hypothetical protein